MKGKNNMNRESSESKFIRNERELARKLLELKLLAYAKCIRKGLIDQNDDKAGKEILDGIDKAINDPHDAKSEEIRALVKKGDDESIAKAIDLAIIKAVPRAYERYSIAI